MGSHEGFELDLLPDLCSFGRMLGLLNRGLDQSDRTVSKNFIKSSRPVTETGCTCAENKYLVNCIPSVDREPFDVPWQHFFMSLLFHLSNLRTASRGLESQKSQQRLQKGHPTLIPS